jgi:FAD/FMN-containing dehydrogenase
LVISLDRMNRIRATKPDTRVIVAEAGVTIQRLQEEAARHGLYFPLTFGARGSAMIGGALSTNAGGSNVLRYGSAREQCLGLEVVLADGRVLDLMSELHKDNSGYALRHLFIGAEGTLGIITNAVLKLVPRPCAHATAMVAIPSIGAALKLLGMLRDAMSGAVEAFEYMPRRFIEAHLQKVRGAREPFGATFEHCVMVEVAAHSSTEMDLAADGTSILVSRFESVLTQAFQEGIILDAVVARSEFQRQEMWARREAAAVVTLDRHPCVDTDVAVPLDCVERFLLAARERIVELDPQVDDLAVAHLGDGNIHYTALPSRSDPALCDAMRAAIDGEAVKLGGTFSAEHGIGLLKLSSMRTHKSTAALETMRAIRLALDPFGILNPGKTIPPAEEMTFAPDRVIGDVGSP